jgi:O-antigen biosynthesis protein
VNTSIYNPSSKGLELAPRSNSANLVPLDTPLVSVIIPVYNSAQYIQKAIASVLQQTYRNYEIIVVDDGSTDETRSKLELYQPKIRYIFQENQGSAAARNTGIKLAQGELIAFLDSDDYWSMPEKLTKQVACFEQNPDLGGINTGWKIVDGAGKHIKTVQPWHKAPQLDLETWLKKKCVRTSAMMFRKEWLEKVGGFDPELRQSHDVDLILRLSLAGCETDWLKEETVCYRQHDSNTTKDSLKQAKYIQAVLDKFFARKDVPDAIGKQEDQIRYHTLVWLAWYQYNAGNLEEMAKFLQQSLDFSPYLRVENIAHWLSSFKRFTEERGKSFDVNLLTNSSQWRKLINLALELKNLATETSETDSNLVNLENNPLKLKVTSRLKSTAKKYQTARLERFPAGLSLPPFPGEHNNYALIESGVQNFVVNPLPYSLSVSIVIACYHSQLALNKVLDAIAAQTYPQQLIEVVIVSPELNREAIALAMRSREFRITFVPQPKLVQQIQNAGMQQANHDYLIVLDGDILPMPNLVENYMRYFHVSDCAVLIGDRRFIDANSLNLNSDSEIADASNSKQFARRDDLKILNAQHKLYEQSERLIKDRYPFRAFVSSNIACAKKLIEQVGCFDESITHWGYRDQELGYRIYNAGYYFIPVADALGLHQNLTSGREQYNKQPSHQESKKLFEQKCPVEWYRNYQSGATYEVPKVSVYIPSYNNGKYIKAAVDSVLNQTYTDVEICICDDGSTDNTLEVLTANFQDNPKVRWVTQVNGGIGKASNTAVRMCRGMYIGQLDSDDLLKPEAIATMVDYLDKKSYGCVYSSCERIDADGNYLQDEYSYPTFSREKMMITSIAHHFRMFRRRDWIRTDGFNEELLNAVDYDMFLKLSEVCTFYHVEKMLYLRRWHGNNTSFVNENKQSSNTHVVLTYALARMGLADQWEVFAPNPQEPRKVSYRPKHPITNIFFFPDYRQGNSYQNLLYAHLPDNSTLYSGDIGDALQAVRDGIDNVVFHLHWTNYILKPAKTQEEAEKLKNAFLKKLFEFLAHGGSLIWTVHNVLPHDCQYLAPEIELRNIICIAARKIHIHSASSLSEIQKYLNVPQEKVTIIPHGNYLGVYPNTISRSEARKKFNFTADQTVFLFLGLIRKYKGIDDLIVAFSRVQQKFPDTHLLIAGKPIDQISFDELDIDPVAKSKITLVERYIPDRELQLFFNVADVAVLPYKNILTSGSLLNAMSFGCPVIAPRVGMTKEIIKDGDNGYLYELQSIDSLTKSMLKIATLKPNDKSELRQQSLASIKHLNWEDTRKIYVTAK